MNRFSEEYIHDCIALVSPKRTGDLFDHSGREGSLNHILVDLVELFKRVLRVFTPACFSPGSG